ncbi:MAG: endonuclease III [Erythrobacter sp.]
MQLDLGTDNRTAALRALQAAMTDCFGRIVRPDEKRRDPVWVLVHGVIGARAKTIVSNQSTDGLLANYGSWEAVAGATIEALTAQLQRQTFPGQSAERLHACLNAIVEQRGKVDLSHLAEMKTAEAMAWLETLPGVARKISAGVMNTSIFNRRAMVIDGHHRRIMQRMGLVPAKADTARAFDVLVPIIPPDWSAEDMDEHHLLLKKLGQSHCRPRAPHCDGCPAAPDCAHANAQGKRP